MSCLYIYAVYPYRSPIIIKRPRLVCHCVLGLIPALTKEGNESRAAGAVQLQRLSSASSILLSGGFLFTMLLRLCARSSSKIELLLTLPWYRHSSGSDDVASDQLNMECSQRCES